jgi:hypothetical protein
MGMKMIDVVDAPVEPTDMIRVGIDPDQQTINLASHASILSTHDRHSGRRQVRRGVMRTAAICIGPRSDTPPGTAINSIPNGHVVGGKTAARSRRNLERKIFPDPARFLSPGRVEGTSSG